MEESNLSCPFCGFLTDSEYQIMALIHPLLNVSQLHMETLHAEGESPFVVRDDASIAAVLASEYDENPDKPKYSSCPVEGCGEQLLFAEFDSHLELHAAEQDADDGCDHVSQKLKLEPEMEATFHTKLSHALRNIGGGDLITECPSPEQQARAKAAWKGLLKMPETSPKEAVADASRSVRRRLGKSELGPHANEKQMPSWLVELLETDGATTTENRLGTDGKLRKARVCKNHAADIIPVLAQLLHQDKTTQYAYLCDSAVRHVSKLKKEGGFCGYRNIQMMSSYIVGARSQGHEFLGDKIPTIFEIQDFIENAWDIGINAQGREETGGIKGTRKYIGTPDAQAMFLSLGIACDAQGINTKKDRKAADPAHLLLFKAVEEYFANGCADFDPKANRRKGHSMTIVGFEKRSDGSKDVIVFDPMFHDAPNVTKLIGQMFTHKAPADLLKAYRRATHYLKRYKEFEILRLTPPKPETPRRGGVNDAPGTV
ncbi:Zinc finger with UFM1-specific peptidase domain protein [Lachnellula willkommii]|uniref:Zinc finger with UFM1-specific peptidase domain protein n=1 Tax=Lachnellula willkommii TaxID=215461 RepID=A0A559M7F7_9HELO|nr:Zinc finger with UFM1-specific peptidase domain protein [Lachnellula willkommii]